MISLSVSPCSNPELTLEQALSAYRELGYNRFELFTSWAGSAVDPHQPPQQYLALAQEHGFAFSSIHLPPVSDGVEESVDRSVRACRFAVELGCRVAIVKAGSKQDYIAAVPMLLDRIDGLAIITVLTNHVGSAISTLADYQEVLRDIGDSRIKCLLEVGQFHSVGVPWHQAYDALAGRIELVHIKDQIGAQSVPFGTGQIDLPALFRRLVEDGYHGDIVVEMEVADRQNTLTYLRDALLYVKEHLSQ